MENKKLFWLVSQSLYKFVFSSHTESSNMLEHILVGHKGLQNCQLKICFLVLENF